MYIPPAFRQMDVEVQRALIAAHPLPLLLDNYPDRSAAVRAFCACQSSR